jgi:hypothetical protein
MPENKLYYGDNLGVLRRYVRDESTTTPCGCPQSFSWRQP